MGRKHKLVLAREFEISSPAPILHEGSRQQLKKKGAELAFSARLWGKGSAYGAPDAELDEMLGVVTASGPDGPVSGRVRVG